MRSVKPVRTGSAARDKDSAVQSIDRAARLLRALAAAPRDGGKLSDIARETGFGKATTHRLLSALTDAGFVFQEVATRRYRLGAGLALLGRAARQHNTGMAVEPALERVAGQTSDTAYASIREGTAAVCIGRAVGDFPIRTLSLDVGDRRPLGVGSGPLALLAFMGDDEIETSIAKNAAWLRKYPGHEAAELRRLVAQTRRRGFALVEGLLIPGMNAIGVPVLDPAGHPVAALSIAAIADRVGKGRIPELVKILKAQAAILAKSLSVE
jgi:DNA-binding IclR family transcriptional regulator